MTNEELKNYTNISVSESTLNRRFEEFSMIDPFPSIAPALLNPWDVTKYVHKTGMIYPFDADDLKTVTYKILLYGDIYYWENNEQKTVRFDRNATTQNTFTLKPNSIIYVHLDTVFRVPYYIALRFNLKIDLVHKGLLLGTGPVIDSGFQGRILVPIHNLTSNSYVFQPGDGLIWVESTKLSSFSEKYKPFPSLLNHSANNYFDGSGILNSGVRSSIPEAIKNAQKSAENAQQSAENSEKKIKEISYVTVLGIIVTVILTLIPTWSLFNDLNNTFNDKKEKLLQEVKEFENKLSEKDQAIQKMADLIKNSEERINALEASQKQNAKKQNETN